MTDRVQLGRLNVARSLHRFIVEEALPGARGYAEELWARADAIIHAFSPRNRELLAGRDELQAQIDGFHRASPGAPDPQAYEDFLVSIGYLAEEPDDFLVTTDGVDAEVAVQAGPQLVVPLLNARFATN